MENRTVSVTRCSQKTRTSLDPNRRLSYDSVNRFTDPKENHYT
jgi:hypothetical protein